MEWEGNLQGETLNTVNTEPKSSQSQATRRREELTGMSNYRSEMLKILGAVGHPADGAGVR